MDRLKTLRVLLIVTYRHRSSDPPWIGRPNVTALILNRLAEREITAMIDRVTGNKTRRNRASDKTLSSAPMASRCSWRK